MSERVSVRFVKPWRGYNAGERAGFSPAGAQALVAAGVVVLCEPEALARPMHRAVRSPVARPAPAPHVEQEE